MKDSVKKFNEAVSSVSEPLRSLLNNLSDEDKACVFEIRLRADKPVVLYGSFKSMLLKRDSTLGQTPDKDVVVCPLKLLTETFNRMCGYSIHSHQTSIVNGFVTLKGGHRAGIAGTAVCEKDGRVISVREISSLNIRIAREKKGCADCIMPLFSDEYIPSVLVAGPPSSGKTTLLRDLIRMLSNFENGNRFKISVIDEREELAAMNGAFAENDIGRNCDVFNSYPKAQAIMTAVKTMSPDIIVCDEIASDSEIEAIRNSVNTGVRFVSSIHASSFNELVSRPQIERLLEIYSFDKVVLLEGASKPCTVSNIFDSGELRDEIYSRRVGLGDMQQHWF